MSTSRELSNKKLIQSLPIPLKSIYIDAYNSHLTEKMKNDNALFLVDLFGSLEKFMGSWQMREKEKGIEEEENDGGESVY